MLQKRLKVPVDFNRDWCNDKRGFGDLNGEFWLGLDKIHRLTWKTQNSLRVDLENISGHAGHAVANYTLSFESHLGGRFLTG